MVIEIRQQTEIVSEDRLYVNITVWSQHSNITHISVLSVMRDARKMMMARRYLIIVILYNAGNTILYSHRHLLKGLD